MPRTELVLKLSLIELDFSRVAKANLENKPT